MLSSIESCCDETRPIIANIIINFMVMPTDVMSCYHPTDWWTRRTELSGYDEKIWKNDKQTDQNYNNPFF